MTTNNITDTEAPEFLYHVKRTIIDFAQDKSGATRNTDILGTFADLAAAKAAAHSALSSEGYVKDDFSNYEENDGIKEWEHGDGIIVFAKAPAGQELEVGLATTPNVLLLKGNASGEVEGFLHYVLQTTIHYNKDRTGGIQTTEVEGVYLTRKAAFEAAKTSLLDEDVTKESFAEYEEKDDDEAKDEWPYGDEVLVHAVADTAENFKISVKAQLHSHRQNGLKHHKRHQTVKESK